MKTEELLDEAFNTAEKPEVVDTDELISDFKFVYNLTKRNCILDFEYEYYGVYIE
ncbi:MAG: hypothetical protein HC830_13870 [Bacteroidetes bacterium]|nr:hypothetical protein [Bacteroidota bacterium]